MRVCAYYNPVPGLWTEESQRLLLALWERNWRAWGWEPRVFTKADAEQLPGYEDFTQRVNALPSAFGPDYKHACFIRWFLMAKQGGGLLVDYDVFNYGLTPDFAHENFGKANMHLLMGELPVSMGAVFGLATHYQSIADRLANWVPEPAFDTRFGQLHCCDQELLKRMLETGTLDRPGWLVPTLGVCARFPEPGWEKSLLVHWASWEMRDAGHWPKHEAVPKLRELKLD